MVRRKKIKEKLKISKKKPRKERKLEEKKNKNLSNFSINIKPKFVLFN